MAQANKRRRAGDISSYFSAGRGGVSSVADGDATSSQDRGRLASDSGGVGRGGDNRRGGRGSKNRRGGRGGENRRGGRGVDNDNRRGGRGVRPDLVMGMGRVQTTSSKRFAALKVGRGQKRLLRGENQRRTRGGGWARLSSTPPPWHIPLGTSSSTPPPHGEETPAVNEDNGKGGDSPPPAFDGSDLISNYTRSDLL